MELLKIIQKNSLIDYLFNQSLNLFFYIVRLITDNQHINNKILLISLQKIGDSVFTLPAIQAIINSNISGKVYLLTYSETKIIFNKVVNNQNIFTVDQKEFKFGNRIATSKARRIIKDANPGIIIDLTGSITSASLIFNSNSKRIIGINEKYYRNIYTDFIEIRRTPHLIEIYCDVAELYLQKKINRESFAYPVNYKIDGIILVHPFAGWDAKQWNLMKFISLTGKLGVEFSIALIFPKNMVKSDVIDYLKFNNIKFIETNSLKELITEIQGCSLFIGNDSGPIYLANYFGKPTFTIYGPTNPDYSKPFGNNHLEIRKLLKCSPIDIKFCLLSGGRNCPSNQCMQMLEESFVLEELLAFISKLKLINRN